VFIKVIREGLLTGEEKVCATAFLTFVALDEEKKPAEVPEIYPETEIEKMLFAGADLRKDRRNERKKESQRMSTLYKSNYVEVSINMKEQTVQEKYANLVLQMVVNLQKDQALDINGSVEGAAFLRLVAHKAYALGAKEDHVNWADDELSLLQ